MRKQFLIIAVLFFCGGGNVSAQTNVYHPMPDSNATWCETAWWGTWCGVSDRYLLTISGDTVIGAEQYHKLYASGHVSCNMQYTFYTDDYRGAFRQDTAQRKVFFVPEYQVAEELLYDFTLTVGDTFPLVGFTPGLLIIGEDSMLVGTNYRKRLLLDYIVMTSGPVYVLEGVGSSCGFFLLNFQAVESGSSLNAFADNSVPLFQPDSFNLCQLIMDAPLESFSYKLRADIFPNPSSGTFTIDFGEPLSVATIEIHDVFGRLARRQIVYGQDRVVCEALPAGLYVLTLYDGKGGMIQQKVASAGE